MNCRKRTIYPQTPLSPVFLHARSSIAAQCQPTRTWAKPRHCMQQRWSDGQEPSAELLLSSRNPALLKAEVTLTSKTDNTATEHHHFRLLFADWGILQCIHYLHKILVTKIPPLLPLLKGVLNNSNVVVESLLSNTRPFWSMKDKFPQVLGGLLRWFASQYTFEKPASVVTL